MEDAVKLIKSAKAAMTNGIDRARDKLKRKRVALGQAQKALLFSKKRAASGAKEDIEALCDCKG